MGAPYRQFALANPHFYAIMFEDAIPHEQVSDTLGEHAADTFGALVQSVELAAAAGMIIAPDATEVAQQLWNAVHGAVALELKGMILTPDPAATYEAFLVTILRGLASPGTGIALPPNTARHQAEAGQDAEARAGHGGHGGAG